MARQETKYQAVLIMTALSAVTLVSIVILISDQSDRVKIFLIGLNIMLFVMNIMASFMIYRSSGTIVDEVFVMTPSGMLLKHYTRRLRPDQDENILAGMLTAVQNFVKESFDGSGGRLSEIKFENFDIYISYSESLVIAAVISSKNPHKLKERIQATTAEIEKSYGPKIRDWSGDLSQLRQIDSIMERLLGRM